MKTKILMSVLAIGMAIALIGGATMAWFTAEADVPEAEFTAGTVVVNADEPEATPAEGKYFGNVNPGDCGRVEWTIINEGTKAAELRVKLEEAWEDDELSTDNFFYAPAPGSDWVMYEDEDGIWLYYVGGPVAGTYGLEEGEDPESVKLELVVAFDGETTGNEYQGKWFKLSGEVEAIQASNDAPSEVWGDAWDDVTEEGYEPAGLAAEYLEYIMETKCWNGEGNGEPGDPPVVEGAIVEYAELTLANTQSGSAGSYQYLKQSSSGGALKIFGAVDGEGVVLNEEYNIVLLIHGNEGENDANGYPVSLTFTDGNASTDIDPAWEFTATADFQIPRDLYLKFGPVN